MVHYEAANGEVCGLGIKRPGFVYQPLISWTLGKIFNLFCNIQVLRIFTTHVVKMKWVYINYAGQWLTPIKAWVCQRYFTVIRRGSSSSVITVIRWQEFSAGGTLDTIMSVPQVSGRRPRTVRTCKQVHLARKKPEAQNCSAACPGRHPLLNRPVPSGGG